MMPVPAAPRADDPAGAVAAVHIVGQRPALAQRHADQVALGGLGRLADRLRHLAGLAVAEADAALLVADDDQRREAEAPAALHHFGDAVDVDQPVDEFALLAVVAAVAAALSSWFSCHNGSFLIERRARSSSLKLQTAFTGRIGQRLDAAVIEVAVAVEDHLLTQFWTRTRQERADLLRRLDLGAVLLARVILERRSRGDVSARLVSMTCA